MAGDAPRSATSHDATSHDATAHAATSHDAMHGAPADATPWSRRLARPEDDAFLDQLYEGTRIEEVLGWGFDLGRARTFLREQARIQRRSYAMQFGDAEQSILLAHGEPRGGLLLAFGAGAWTLVSVAVLPESRDRGLGTWAVREVLARAGSADRSVRLMVDPHNRARRLYRRLGFRDALGAATRAEDALRPIDMEWRACE